MLNILIYNWIIEAVLYGSKGLRWFFLPKPEANFHKCLQSCVGEPGSHRKFHNNYDRYSRFGARTNIDDRRRSCI